MPFVFRWILTKEGELKRLKVLIMGPEKDIMYIMYMYIMDGKKYLGPLPVLRENYNEKCKNPPLLIKKMFIEIIRTQIKTDFQRNCDMLRVRGLTCPINPLASEDYDQYQTHPIFTWLQTFRGQPSLYNYSEYSHVKFRQRNQSDTGWQQTQRTQLGHNEQICQSVRLPEPSMLDSGQDTQPHRHRWWDISFHHLHIGSHLAYFMISF